MTIIGFGMGIGVVCTIVGDGVYEGGGVLDGVGVKEGVFVGEGV